jgi:hypothetical protein
VKVEDAVDGQLDGEFVREGSGVSLVIDFGFRGHLRHGRILAQNGGE